MQKMGYIVGTGLGKNSEGRVDPVTAVILPQGKSLGKYFLIKCIFGVFFHYIPNIDINRNRLQINFILCNCIFSLFKNLVFLNVKTLFH